MRALHVERAFPNGHREASHTGISRWKPLDGVSLGWGFTTVFTVFIRASDGQAVSRQQGDPCTGPNGEACSGAACYYGPNGFSRASTWRGGAYGLVDNGWYENCVTEWSDTPFESYWIMFPDVTGTFPTGQGCPGGATGAAQWDY